MTSRSSEVAHDQFEDRDRHGLDTGLNPKAKTFKPGFNGGDMCDEGQECMSMTMKEETVHQAIAIDELHVLSKHQIDFEMEENVLDSKEEDMPDMFIEDPGVFKRVTTEGRNEDILKIVRDSRQERNTLIAETDDFILIYDMINNQDTIKSQNKHNRRHLG